MRKRWLVAVVLACALGAVTSPVGAQEADRREGGVGVGAEPPRVELEDFAEIDGGALLSPVYSGSVDAFVEKWGVSRETAERRVHDSLVLDEFVRRLRVLPGVIAVKVTHTEDSATAEVLVGPKAIRPIEAEGQAVLGELGLPYVKVVTRASGVSLERREEVAAELEEQLARDGFERPAVSVNKITGELVIEVAEGGRASDAERTVAEFRSGRAGDVPSSLFRSVEVVRSEVASLAGGGERMRLENAAGDGFNCTSGYAVHDPDGPAMMTAGHCQNFNVSLFDTSGSGVLPGSAPTELDFGDAIFDGYNAVELRDSQFHRTSEAAIDPAIRIASDGERHAIKSSRTVVAGTGNVCYFGNTSLVERCGTVLQDDFIANFDQGPGNPTFSLPNHLLLDSEVRSGDSGGPVYLGDLAVGIIAGGRETTGQPCLGFNASGGCNHWPQTIVAPLSLALEDTDFTLMADGSSGGYNSLFAPQRLMDSRWDAAGNPRPPATLWTVNVRGSGGVPQDPNVAGVVLNVTTVAPSSSGYVTVYANGTARPVASSGNYPAAGTVIAHQVTVPLTWSQNAVRIFSSATSHVVVDVAGYYLSDDGDGELDLLPTPVRAIDSRQSSSGPIGAGQSRTVLLPQVSASAEAVTLNVTAITPSAGTYLTIWAASNGRPGVSHLNAAPGEVIANQVTTRVSGFLGSSTAAVKIYNNSGSTHYIIDVLAEYDSFGDVVVPVAPTRVFDTRIGLNSPTGVGKIPANSSRDVQVAGFLQAPIIPANATGVVLRAIAVGPTAASHLTVSPGGASSSTSTLNFAAGQTRSNAVVVDLNNGEVRVSTGTAATHVVLDVEGYVYDDS